WLREPGFAPARNSQCAGSGDVRDHAERPAVVSSWFELRMLLRTQPAVNGAASEPTAPRRSEYLQHRLWRAAKHGAIAVDHDRPLDDDRMLHHAGDKLRVGESGLVEPRLGCFLLAQQLARRQAKETQQ